jgi:hypothetical protein
MICHDYMLAILRGQDWVKRKMVEAYRILGMKLGRWQPERGEEFEVWLEEQLKKDPAKAAQVIAEALFELAKKKFYVEDWRKKPDETLAEGDARNASLLPEIRRDISLKVKDTGSLNHIFTTFTGKLE